MLYLLLFATNFRFYLCLPEGFPYAAQKHPIHFQITTILLLMYLPKQNVHDKQYALIDALVVLQSNIHCQTKDLRDIADSERFAKVSNDRELLKFHGGKSFPGYQNGEMSKTWDYTGRMSVLQF